MSIEKFKELGRSLPAYREWRATQIKRGAVRHAPAVTVVDTPPDPPADPPSQKKFPGQRFRTSFLQKEGGEGADLVALDAQLFLLYERLEMSRPLPPADKARWQELHENMFEYKG